jgi:hypothetical protein
MDCEMAPAVIAQAGETGFSVFLDADRLKEQQRVDLPGLGHKTFPHGARFSIFRSSIGSKAVSDGGSFSRTDCRRGIVAG